MTVLRQIALGLTGLFLVLLPVQYLFASYGIFSGDFDTHLVFGGMVLHGIALLITICFLLARQWRLGLLGLILVIAIFVQISLVSIGEDNNLPWLAAFHPVMAFAYWPYLYFLVWVPARADDGVQTKSVEPGAGRIRA